MDVWDPDWTTGFVDMLTVLTRLVELEPAQADLLERILAGPLLTMEDLGAAGVRWPTKPADRRPQPRLRAQLPDPTQLDLHRTTCVPGEDSGVKSPKNLPRSG